MRCRFLEHSRVRTRVTASPADRDRPSCRRILCAKPTPSRCLFAICSRRAVQTHHCAPVLHTPWFRNLAREWS